MHRSTKQLDDRSFTSACWAALRLAFTLYWRFWPQLTAIWLSGFIGNTLLNELAAKIGRWNSLAGLSTLSLVVLLKLVIIIALFDMVRPGLVCLNAASSRPASTANQTLQVSRANFVTALSLSLIPFFAFYTAWGFLADTIRDYSRLSLDLMLAGDGSKLLEVSDGEWLFAPITVAWLIRRGAKALHQRSKASIWPIIIVICEANWVFIGIFVLSNWQGEIRAWLSHLPETIGIFLGLLQPVSEASAQGVPPPPETAIDAFDVRLKSIFFYSIYPVVWMTLAALIYGYDINGERPLSSQRVAGAIAKWNRVPKIVRDFISHFVAGTVKRYRALAEGVGLTIGSGVALTLFAAVTYRLLDWASAWAWFGISQWIGPQNVMLWQIIAQAISLFFGTPSDPGYGLLIMPMKVCLLSATLEVGFSKGREWRIRA